MIDMGQADRTLRHTPSGDDGVFDRHRERVQRMKLKTSEAKDKALDYLVAKCEGKGIEFDDPSDPWLTLEGIAYQPLHSYTPSTDWAQGGPIIERERLKVVYFASSQEWNVSKLRYGGLCEPHDMKDPSLLVAAMRCYVASKLGDEVEIPEELI